MRRAIKLEEAVQKLLAQDREVGQMVVHVNDSLNYTLANDMYSPYDSPAFHRSVYDGFAIREEDDHDFPKSFTIAGVVACGEVFDRSLLLNKVDETDGEGDARGIFAGSLLPNETVRIMTGAKLPDNAHKVVMLEQTVAGELEGTVVLQESPTSTNVIPIGSEFKKGEKILNKGHIINAGTISLLHSFGIETVPVFAKPRVAVLSTGSELLSLGEPIQDGKIYDSNRPLIEQLLKATHCDLVYTGKLADDKAQIEKCLQSLLHQADVIITIGGVSVGDFDFMAHIVEDNHGLFNKIQMRPGSPTSAAMLGHTLLLALSGNPGACFIGFHLFVKPYLNRLSGSQAKARKCIGVLQRNYSQADAFDRILRADYMMDETGKLCVTPVGSDHSNALGNLHETTCLIKIPGGESGRKQGDLVEVFLL